MKQPKVELFGETYEVYKIEFNRDGSIDAIWYYWPEERYGVNVILRHDVDEPTTHPHEGYIAVANFGQVLKH